MGDQTTIVVGNPIVKDSKAPSTSCPHGDDKTIIQGHASKEIKNHKEEEQTQVQEVENLSRVFNLETTLPNTGPGTSAFMTSRWLFLLLSIIARAKTNTPIPPQSG